MTDEEIIKDDTEAMENELANLTAFIQTLTDKAAVIRMEMSRIKRTSGYVPGVTDLWGFTKEDVAQWVAEARQKGIEI